MEADLRRWADRMAIAVAVLGLVLFAGCGGGDRDSPSGSNATTPADSSAASDSQAEPTTGQNGGPGVGLGTAIVEIEGAESFSFDLTCTLAFQTVQGAGERNDGVPAYLRAVVPREGGSSSAVSLLIKVGATQLSDAGAYQWTAEGEPELREDSRISGALQFEYGGGTESRFTEGDVKDGSFDFDCR